MSHQPLVPPVMVEWQISLPTHHAQDGSLVDASARLTDKGWQFNLAHYDEHTPNTGAVVSTRPTLVNKYDRSSLFAVGTALLVQQRIYIANHVDGDQASGGTPVPAN